MSCRSTSHDAPRCHGGRIAALVLAACLAGAVDLSVPSDVPDEAGLGERLALVAWLQEHRIPVPDPQDLPALRLAYARVRHPEASSPAPSGGGDEERGEAAAALYRAFGRNPPPGASTAEIRALIATLEREAAARRAQEEAAAERVSAARLPAPAPPAASPETAAAPTAPAAPARERSAYEQQRDAARAAAGIVVGKPFPVLAGQTVDGAAFNLTQWRGRVVLVDFWATWCGPCMHEMPNVVAAYASYHDHGFEVVGVSLDHDREALRKTLAERAILWPQLCDWQGWRSAFAQQYAITGIPAAFLIGKRGDLLATDLRGPSLDQAIEKALAEKP